MRVAYLPAKSRLPSNLFYYKQNLVQNKINRRQELFFLAVTFFAWTDLNVRIYFSTTIDGDPPLRLPTEIPWLMGVCVKKAHIDGNRIEILFEMLHDALPYMWLCQTQKNDNHFTTNKNKQKEMGWKCIHIIIDITSYWFVFSSPSPSSSENVTFFSGKKRKQSTNVILNQCLQKPPYLLWIYKYVNEQPP